MGIQIKLPSIDFAKVGDVAGKSIQSAMKFAGDHKVEFLSCISLAAIGDNIRVRLERKKDQKIFEESSAKQQEVTRKHEAEINALKAEAEQAQEVSRRVKQLDQIVKNITKGDGNVWANSNIQNLRNR